MNRLIVFKNMSKCITELMSGVFGVQISAGKIWAEPHKCMHHLVTHELPLGDTIVQRDVLILFVFTSWRCFIG